MEGLLIFLMQGSQQIYVQHTENTVFYLHLQGFVREEDQKKTWFEARDFCREIGGDLAAIRNEEEQTAIENLIK